MFEEILLILTLSISMGTLGFTVIKCWLTWKMLKESRTYWSSWKERSKDVAEKVLSEISTSDLRAELKRRMKERKKEECPTQVSEQT